MSVSELARRARLSQQSVDAILQSPEGRMMRASRRRALADALGVAEELLAAEGAYPRPGSRLGYEYHYSARTQLAAQRLLTRCDKAAARDLKEFAAQSPPIDDDLARETLSDVIADLMAIGSWRERVLRWDPPRHPRQGYREPLAEDIEEPHGPRPEGDPAHERGTLALIDAIEHILTPWFEDRARLDYAALREFVTTMPQRHTATRQHPFAIVPPEPTSEATPT
jgi:transcriptional regulator with XRE-family HTH domain